MNFVLLTKKRFRPIIISSSLRTPYIKDSADEGHEPLYTYVSPALELPNIENWIDFIIKNKAL